MNFIARIHANERKQGTHMVLLTQVHNESENELFRDHCWVKASKKILSAMPKTNKNSIIIRFSADIEKYPYESNKKRLTKIKNIEIAG